MKTKDILLRLLVFVMTWLSGTAFAVGTWTPLANQPTDYIGICLLLSDGTVLGEGVKTQPDTTWYKLTPDSNGHYINGQWSARHSSSWGHQEGSTAVLQSGNVFVAGGEHGNNFASAEIYNPTNDSWSVAANPTFFGNIEDGNAILLANGQVLIEPQEASGSYSDKTFTFNPANNQFTETAGAPLHGIGESTWVKLPNDNILVIDSDNSSAGATTSEQYDPYTGVWTNGESGVPNIWPDVSGSGYGSEMGPGFLLPNGNVVFFGGNGATAVYSNGVWSTSATIPNGLAIKEGGGAMMVNGKILLACSPPGVNSDPNDINGIGPTSIYEYDYTANGGAGGYTQTSTPGGVIPGIAGGVRFLALPDGTILASGIETNQLYVYQPDGSPLVAGKPAINSVQWNNDGSLHITGTLFNGISQGGSYGDDEQMASNYPLVRFTDGSGNVSYGTTYNWSSTGVQTGSKIVTTECTLPANIFDGPGNYSLQVVANGNASDPVTFSGPVWVDFNYTSNAGFYFGLYEFPYNTLATGISNVATNGTIAINSSVQPSASSETMLISKPMTIVSVGGTALIGH